MVFGQLVMAVQCCAEAGGSGGASAQHCIGMANWQNTSEDIMSFCIKFSASEGVGAEALFRNVVVFFPNQACLWGSYSKERISVDEGREGGSPAMQDRFPQRSWYRDLGTKILVVPRSW